MSRRILILDTSILCCWLRVPGKDTAGAAQDHWDYDRINQLLQAERARGSLFVLPIASLIETGNHISQCRGDRFVLATSLVNHLQNSIDASSPWTAFTEQSTLWEPSNLQELAATWPNLAVGGTSIGDATIKHVAEHYSKAGFEVEILTGDEGLKAYETKRPSQVPRRRT